MLENCSQAEKTWILA